MIRRAVVILAVAAALAGCTPASPSGPSVVPEPSQAASPVATPGPAPSAGADAGAWAPAGRPVDAAGYLDDEGLAFRSPSGNISCGYSVAREPGFWYCLLVDREVDLPEPPPAVCEGVDENGDPLRPNGLAMDPADPAASPTSFCATGGDGAVLPYGSSVTYRDLGCDSTPDGMICRSLVSGRGFRLSRSDYELF